jgi:hypothetical protein
MKLNEFILLEAALSIPQISKYPRYDHRVDVLVNKIISGEPFTLVNGQSIVIQPDEQQLEVLRARDWDTFKTEYKSSFTTKDGKTIPITQLQKTAEFGGEASGKRVSKENFAMEQLNSKIEEIKKETNSSTLTIMVGRKKYPNIVRARSTPGHPKSDFHLETADKQAVVFISHKDGKRPSDFQQWSGVTEPGIIDHPETQDFIKAIRRRVVRTKGKTFPTGQAWGRPIEDLNLMMRSMYGADFGGRFGINNVQIIIQGNVSLIPHQDGVYKLTGDIVHLNGQMVSPEYAPTFIVRYSSERINAGIKNARIGILPARGRKIHKII